LPYLAKMPWSHPFMTSMQRGRSKCMGSGFMWTSTMVYLALKCLWVISHFTGWKAKQWLIASCC
jgi:hypothetical protein